MAVTNSGTEGLLGVNFNDVFAPSLEYPKPQFAVGTISDGGDGTEYVYCTTATTLTAGDVVRLSTAWVASGITTANALRGDFVGVMAQSVVSGNYFWVQRKGICPLISVLASALANTRLNTTATAGALDDDGTATSKQVQGIYLTTTRGGTAGTAPGTLNYPTVDVTL